MSRKVFSETILTRWPEGSKAAIAVVCERHRISLTDVIREGVAQILEREGVPVPCDLEQRRARLPTVADPS